MSESIETPAVESGATGASAPVAETPKAPSSIAEASRIAREALRGKPEVSGEQVFAQVESEADGIAPVIDQTGRAHDPATGKFTSKADTTGTKPAEASAEPEAPAVEQAAETPADEPTDAPEPIRVVIKGRNGEREIEVTDPELADDLRANANDGMRRDEFTRRMSGIESREAEMRALEEHIATNPEDIVFNHLPEDKRIGLTVRLMAQYWDHVVPYINQYAEQPASRIQAAADAQIAIRDNARALDQKRAAAKTASAIESAVRSLIPESADESEMQDFMGDALSDLRAAIASGQQVTPESVPALLTRRLTRYGWSASSSQAPARPVVRAVTPATPTAPAPQAPSRPVATPSPVIQNARRNAAAVAPQGAGAGPQASPIPKEATRSIADASRWAKAQLKNRQPAA